MATERTARRLELPRPRAWIGPVESTWLDRVVGYVSPARELRRIRARVAKDLLLRHYEGGAGGRRTKGWKRSAGDANSAVAASLSSLRENARDLVRNNPHATQGVRIIANQIVGWGIVAKALPKHDRMTEAWAAWAGTRACDADGRHDFAGLQKLAARCIVESGEVLIRRRWRLPTDNLPIPFQLQLLEPDYLDTSRTGIRLQNGGRIMHGIELDAIGRRVAYWLFPEHPGAVVSLVNTIAGGASVRVDAADVIHAFHQERIGQLRGVTWFAPIVLKLKDYDEYDDATLMKQRIAACLAVITSDVDGSGAPLGTKDDTATPEIDSIEPGMILNVAPGRTVQVVEPPSVREYGDYTQVSLRTVSAGLGVTYEDLTGDYTDLPFSAARMSRIAHQARIEDWRWRTMIPQLCDPVWGWALEAAMVMGIVKTPIGAAWTAPPAPFVDPSVEGLAVQRNIRGGIQTWSESVRERGYDPDEVLAEMASDAKKFDRLGIILDSDARKTTQAGLPRDASAAGASSSLPAPEAGTPARLAREWLEGEIRAGRLSSADVDDVLAALIR